jgi:hypothetical protein
MTKRKSRFGGISGGISRTLGGVGGRIKQGGKEVAFRGIVAKARFQKNAPRYKEGLIKAGKVGYAVGNKGLDIAYGKPKPKRAKKYVLVNGHKYIRVD